MKLIRDQRRTQTTNDTEAGTALVLFAVLVFAILGIAALTVDVAFANVGQAQMQAAADTASLEGLRLRDYDVYRWRSDLFRRPLMSELVRQTMDDDLHPTGGLLQPDPFRPGMPPDDPDAFRFGAGPSIRLVNGLGADNASAEIVIPDGSTATPGDQWIDDPALEQNRRNAACGDIVSGRHVPYAAHVEDDSYNRDDFVPAIPVGSDTSGGSNAIGMLVRMRRTTGDNILDHVDQISSHGNPLPFLFGMGTSIHAGGAYNPRRDGITMRAVAIASGRPALRIGPPPRQPDGSPVLDRRGEPVLGVGFWRTPASGGERWVSIAFHFEGFWRPYVGTAKCGAGSVGIVERNLVYSPDGTIRDQATNAIAGHLMFEGGCLGDLVTDDVTSGPSALTAADVRAIFESIGPGYRSYFPVYSDFTSAAGVTTHNVIGFGYGRIDGPASGSGSLQLKYTLDFDTRHVPSAATIVAYDNASATITRRRLRNDVPSDVWEQLFSRAVEFTYPPIAPSLPAQVSGDWRDVRVGSVLAPALTR